jgi:hypothetical protein
MRISTAHLKTTQNQLVDDMELSCKLSIVLFTTRTPMWTNTQVYISFYTTYLSSKTQEAQHEMANVVKWTHNKEAQIEWDELATHNPKKCARAWNIITNSTLNTKALHYGQLKHKIKSMKSSLCPNQILPKPFTIGSQLADDGKLTCSLAKVLCIASTPS